MRMSMAHPKEEQKDWELVVGSLQDVPQNLLCSYCMELFRLEKEPYRPFYSLISL